MKKKWEYDWLVDLDSGARLLSAVSDNKEVVSQASQIKEMCKKAVKGLGYTESELQRDSVALYKEKLEDWKKANK